MEKKDVFFQEYMKLLNYSNLKKYKSKEIREVSLESAKIIWGHLHAYSKSIFLSNIEGINLADFRLMLIANYLDSGEVLNVTRIKLTDEHWKTLSKFKAFAQNIKYNFEKWFSDMFFNMDGETIKSKLNNDEFYKSNKIQGLFIYNLYSGELYNIINKRMDEIYYKTLMMFHIKLENEKLKGYINPIIGGFFNNEKTIYV